MPTDRSITTRIRVREGQIPPPLAPSAYGYGPYDNLDLVLLAAQLRAFGHTEGLVLRRAYAPFIIGGPAHWTNSWGALRHDPDGTIRRHMGQDVSCDAGAPVLAAEKGTIEFGSDPLGGVIARLHRQRGGYFYYAHLQSWNTDDLSSGDRVVPGDVIGYCGNSGNAAGSAPHVHFGYFTGGAQDPMGFLLDWQQRAKRRAQRMLGNEVGGAKVSELQRRFGDDVVPLPLGSVDDVAGAPVRVLFDNVLDDDPDLPTARIDPFSWIPYAAIVSRSPD